ncbi:hypothetical protein ACFYZJ_35820 [Streptomyces sp. NPDC001848]|uniref:hypothetical protein n=1 Tax=Streptomyces sp. NPDC001848 TaxID=3364618 RepID=UPI0036A9B64D
MTLPYYRWQRFLPPALRDRTAGRILVAAAAFALLVVIGGSLAKSGSEGSDSPVPPGYAQGYEDGQEMRQEGLYAADEREAKRRCDEAASTAYISGGELQQDGWDQGCLDGLQGNPRRD